MKWHSLRDDQLQAARMAAAGARNVDIAKELGVSQSTVSKWKHNPEYVRVVAELHEMADERAVEDARVLRTKAGEGILLTAGRIVSMLQSDEIDPETVARLGKLALDIWRVTSGQTGVGEVQRAEVSVTAPEEASRLLRQQLEALNADELRAIAADAED